jgi:hypothetical protein
MGSSDVQREETSSTSGCVGVRVSKVKAGRCERLIKNKSIISITRSVTA